MYCSGVDVHWIVKPIIGLWFISRSNDGYSPVNWLSNGNSGPGLKLYFLVKNGGCCSGCHVRKNQRPWPQLPMTGWLLVVATSATHGAHGGGGLQPWSSSFAWTWTKKDRPFFRIQEKCPKLATIKLSSGNIPGDATWFPKLEGQFKKPLKIGDEFQPKRKNRGMYIIFPFGGSTH